MAKRAQHQPAERLLIVMPTWFGDCLMATPTLRALRQLWPAAHIAAVIREAVAPLVEGLTSVDQVIPMPRKGPGASAFRMAKRLSAMKFDTAVLLPNSFRAAALASMAGIPRRIGYDRDGRGVLLTDRLIPRRNGPHVSCPCRRWIITSAWPTTSARSRSPDDHLDGQSPPGPKTMNAPRRCWPRREGSARGAAESRGAEAGETLARRALRRARRPLP